MVLVLMAICLLLIVGWIIFYVFYVGDLDLPGFVIPILLYGCALLATIIFSIILGVAVSSEKALFKKIEIYSEENTRLEQSIDDIVKNYLLYETDVYEQFKNDESTVLIQLFPELKANELVMKQMEIIQANNDQIKELNSQIADLSTSKWWLYFGN